MTFSKPTQSSAGTANESQRWQWIGWLPAVLFPAGAFSLGKVLLPWEFMWILAFSIFAALKWLTWWRARTQVQHPGWRSAAYLLVWPGMDAKSFLGSTIPPQRATAQQWFWAVLKTGLGASCLWFIPHEIPPSDLLLRGWVGMLGLILLLHFGSFQILSFIWQSVGIAATPIMSAPLLSHSLSEFWGRRWNLGFRQLAHDLVFCPLHRRLGTGGAGFLVFVISGLLHDLVISIPARRGYGLPTLYFVLQGIGVAIERSDIGQQLHLGQGIRGWIFMAAVTAAPAFWLFHPPFVHTVILPFMKAIRAQ